jgi:hypothetical protein
LRRAIDSIDGERLTLGQLVDALGRSGQGLVLLLLALPAFIPVPALPTGLVFGTALTLVAMQMIGGREALTLPDFLRQRVAAQTGDGFAADANRAHRRLENPIHALQQRGLARAVRSKHCNQFPLPHRKTDILQNGMVGIMKRHALHI